MLPKPIAPQTLAGLKSNSSVYETAKQQLDGHNALIISLSPGKVIGGSDFSLPQATNISSVTGTFKRGRFTVNFATNPPHDPAVMLNFPFGAFTTQPFATIVRNGGTGTLGFHYSENVNGLTIYIEGTPMQNSTYGFQFAVRE